ncbi:hypothetical protein K488DRAFT_91287 [Vararia minispora EC-137]|uniref:Uncharacterized protein n=1 Tax=Vararia minispora EC-137 TaxID=1314806 RepID=A0ACB8Q605_9AGAM|nr:hypothetical protein K488DRAFT_91287 [Vararia minispora EC-137]
MASSAADTASRSDVADVTEPKIINIMYRNKLGLYKQISLRVSVVRAPLQLPTGNLKAKDAVPLLASGQQSTSPASITPYEPGSTDNRPAQNPAQLSTSGLPVVEITPEENTTNISSTVDVSNTDPPPLASAIVDGANLVNAINTQVDSWTTLLDNVNFVAQILDKISQVFFSLKRSSPSIQRYVDTSICKPGVRRVVCYPKGQSLSFEYTSPYHTLPWI